MKANRKTMLGVALAVAVIALAGIGYALAGGYTAKATSNSNDATNKYITLKLAEDANDDATVKTAATGVYTGQTVVIEYNTVTTNDDSITYEMKEDEVVMNFVLKVTGTPNTSSDKYTITFTTLPNITVEGGTAKWYWSGSDTPTTAIVSNAAFTNKAITDMNDTTLSLKIAKGAASTTAPSTTSIDIGTVVIDILNTA